MMRKGSTVSSQLDSDTDMDGLLIKIEASAHREGWDGPAKLYVIYDATDLETDHHYRRLMGMNPRLGPSVGHGGLRAQAFLNEEFFHELVESRGEPRLEVGEAFRNAAVNIAYADEEESVNIVRRVLLGPSTLGFAFCGETYKIGMSWEEQKRDHRAIADIPGAKKARICIGIDKAERMWMLTRVRGKKPLVSDCDRLGGRLSMALLLLVMALNDAVPPMEELEKVFPNIRVCRPDEED
jgi:hypothetical protein